MSKFLAACVQTTLDGGVGALELDPPPAEYRSAVDAGAGADSCIFTIRGRPNTADANRWEIVHSTVTPGANGAKDRLERELTVRSSNDNQPVNWTAGVQKIVFSAVSPGALNGLLGTFLGPTRPPELQAGGLWTSNAADPIWVLYQYDGATDHPVMRINTATGISLDAVAEPADPADVGKVYVALAGGAHGWGQVGAAGIANGAVNAAKLAAAAVQTDKLDDRVVTRAKIGLDAVGADEIEDESIDAAHLNSGDAVNLRAAIGAEAAGTAAAVAAALAAHEGDTGNPHDVAAAQVGYDNGSSGLASTDLQGAVDEVVGAISGADSGIVLGHAQALYTATNSVSAPVGTWANVPGMAAGLTIQSATSRLLIKVHLSAGAAATRRFWFRVVRYDGTPIAQGDAAGSRLRGVAGLYVPGPSDIVALSFELEYSGLSGARTFYLQCASEDSSAQTLYVNRSGSWPDSNRQLVAASRMTVTEIAA